MPFPIWNLCILILMNAVEIVFCSVGLRRMPQSPQRDGSQVGMYGRWRKCLVCRGDCLRAYSGVALDSSI